jgi:peptidoglycan/xylan/chitin deacetylase (PgdA/CDA1 family)
MKDNRTILLTFDVEEFDLPLEYNIPIPIEEQLTVAKRGMDEVEHLLSNHNIPATLFTTARYAIEYPDQIKALSQKHEIASHTYYHSSFEKKDLLESRLELERITGKIIKGLRMPRMKKVDMEWVKEAGYTYDSSINPTFLPGRYNNLHLPRTLYKQEGMQRLPASVTPHLRIPLFWLGFKNMPYFLFRKLAIQTLKKDGYLSLYFHPWEFTDISYHKLPFYVKRHSGKRLTERLSRLINDLSDHGSFEPVDSFLNT